MRYAILFSLLLLLSASYSFGQASGYYLDFARERFRQGDYDGAIAEATKAIEADPASASAYTYRGIVHLTKKEYSEAMSDLERAIQLDPKHSDAYYYRGDVRLTTKGDTDGALSDWTKAIDLGSVNPLFRRGILRFRLKDYEGAIDDFTRAIKVFPDAGALYQERAKAYRALGKMELAKADEDKVASMKKP